MEEHFNILATNLMRDVKSRETVMQIKKTTITRFMHVIVL